LTPRAVERLENSKFRGLEGIDPATILTVPEKYNLKYVLSNDKFYDPILYFWMAPLATGNWDGLGKVECSPVIKYLHEDVPLYQKLMWELFRC
jgi:hypothetical protein